jgi:hypothetical protein
MHFRRNGSAKQVASISSTAIVAKEIPRDFRAETNAVEFLPLRFPAGFAVALSKNQAC